MDFSSDFQLLCNENNRQNLKEMSTNRFLEESAKLYIGFSVCQVIMYFSLIERHQKKPIFNIKYITIDIPNIFLLVFNKGNQTKSVLYEK